MKLIKGHPTRRQVIWSQCSDPLLGRDEVTRTNRGAEGIGGRVKDEHLRDFREYFSKLPEGKIIGKIKKVAAVKRLRESDIEPFPFKWFIYGSVVRPETN
jgi:hypothetical protein